MFTLTLLVLLVSTAAKNPGATDQKGIVFFEGTWKEALMKARKENKPIFLDIYASWCVSCKLMKFNTFSNKKIAEFYNRSFINVSLNGEEGDGAILAAKYQIREYPTLIYLNKNGSPILYATGYLSPRKFMGIANAAVKKNR